MFCRSVKTKKIKARVINEAKMQQNIGVLSERMGGQNFGILRSIFRRAHRPKLFGNPAGTEKRVFLPFPMHGGVSRKRRNYD